MPLVILPISAYVAFDNFFFAGITIVIWRLLTYYKYRILNFVLSFFITKIIIICLLITLSILTIDIYLKTIIVILLSSAIPIYFTLDNATIKVKRNIRVLLMITGMVISGFLIKIIIVANYYFICFTIFLLFAGKTKDFKKWLYF